jgi:hypothetical protein
MTDFYDDLESTAIVVHPEVMSRQEPTLLTRAMPSVSTSHLERVRRRMDEFLRKPNHNTYTRLEDNWFSLTLTERDVLCNEFNFDLDEMFRNARAQRTLKLTLDTIKWMNDSREAHLNSLGALSRPSYRPDPVPSYRRKKRWWEILGNAFGFVVAFCLYTIITIGILIALGALVLELQ